MKKGDFVWGFVLLAIVAFIAYPTTGDIFRSQTKAHPYIMGFIKVAILASMGELLAMRIATGQWKKPVGMMWRTLIWGLLGVSFAITFPLFSEGIKGLMTTRGMLPNWTGAGFGNKLLFAFCTSAFMNLIFGPTFMALHRVTDTYIDLCEGKLSNLSNVSLRRVTSTIDWNGFVGFVVVKTIPFFWIWAHTVTFCLPTEYQVLMAAMLSIVLGAILAYAKRKPQTANA